MVALSPGVKVAGHETDHMSNAEIKHAWGYSSPPYAFTSWCLIKHRRNFVFASNILYLLVKVSLNCVDGSPW
jgi:hypothetical protein